MADQPFDPWLPTIEHIKDVAVKCGLTFVVEGPTDRSARRFHIVLNDEKLCSADDPMQCEFYLYGYRDAQSRGVTSVDPDELKSALTALEYQLSEADDARYDLGQLLLPITRY